LAAALLALIPGLGFAVSRNLPEYLVIGFYTLTIFSLRMSLRPGREWWVVAAGLFAGLSYLTKSATGPLFLVAGVMGFLWRYSVVGRAVFLDRPYLAGAAVFSSIVGLWGLRNLMHFRSAPLIVQLWSWQGSDYLLGVYRWTFPAHTLDLLISLAIFSGLSLAFLAAFAWPFSPQLREALRRPWDARISLLVVATLVPFLIGLPMGSLYFTYEATALAPRWNYAWETYLRYFFVHLQRYLFVALVPLLWLAFEGAGRPVDVMAGAKASPQAARAPSGQPPVEHPGKAI
jgi:hypothetical protein